MSSNSINASRPPSIPAGATRIEINGRPAYNINNASVNCANLNMANSRVITKQLDCTDPAEKCYSVQPVVASSLFQQRAQIGAIVIRETAAPPVELVQHKLIDVAEKRIVERAPILPAVLNEREVEINVPYCNVILHEVDVPRQNVFVKRIVVPKTGATSLSKQVRFEPARDKSNLIVKWECVSRVASRPVVEYVAQPQVVTTTRVCTLCGCPYDPLVCSSSHASAFVTNITAPTPVSNYNNTFVSSSGPCIPGVQPVQTISEDALEREHRSPQSVPAHELPEEVRRMPPPPDYDYLDDVLRVGGNGRMVPRLVGSPDALEQLRRVPRERLREVGLGDYLDQIDQLGRVGAPSSTYYNNNY